MLEKAFVHLVRASGVFSRPTSGDALRMTLEYFGLSGSSVWPEKIVFSFDITRVESEVSIIQRLSQSHRMGLLSCAKNVTKLTSPRYLGYLSYRITVASLIDFNISQ
jgi:hypothetical protein